MLAHGLARATKITPPHGTPRRLWVPGYARGRERYAEPGSFGAKAPSRIDEGLAKRVCSRDQDGASRPYPAAE